MRKEYTYRFIKLRASLYLQNRRIVFLHLPKCAGSTLHHALREAGIGPLLSERHNGLRDQPAEQMGRARFFSGHFDIESLDCIPGSNKQVFTLLRNPERRLVSAYRFLRAHRQALSFPDGENTELVTLARRYGPVEFFSHPDLVRHPSINNAMVRQLSGHLDQKRWEAYWPGRQYQPTLADEAPQNAVDRAFATISNMTAFGIVEQMDDSIRIIFRQLRIRPPKTISNQQVLEDIARNSAALEIAPRVEITAELREAIAPHVMLDNDLYSRATEVFARRIAAN